ncbi:MAG TPA: Gfo/Idh/MocA family oxidoreductase, partial [Geminicoccaceae bacterium]|nr:Gfo/Idh/MocA family oxidoreductase [Geminicoccaceae bacterium]
ALTTEDALAMVAACRDAGVPLMVHENFRWQTPLMAVRRVIDSGEIGQTFFGRVSWRTGYDVFANQPYLAEEERFIISDLGVHVLDTARFLFGDVRRLACATARVNPRVRGEDTATMLLTHLDGAVSVVDCSYATRVEPDPFPETLVEVDGERGSIRLLPGYAMVVHAGGRTERRDVAPRLLPWATPPWHLVQESVLNIQRHWVECLRTGREPATSARDNMKTFALVEAAYEAADTGRVVEMGGGDG